ncbi:MAG: ATPase [Clostridia bacterium]|nr:ATPase [Clostridia bacterium]
MEKLFLGIELGSTRIKAVLTDKNSAVLAIGAYDWENTLVDGLWSYPLDEAVKGLQTSYKRLAENYGKPLTHIDAIGISGMMHGYLAFDKDGKLLAPFRTWRNTNTGEAAGKLTKLFNFNVPLRWSVSQYYQSYLDKLAHVKDVAFLTTLAGYIHYLLTGEKVIGANDASGMFPLSGRDYDGEMLKKFNKLIGRDFKALLPKVMLAGENAGTLTKEGALLLDPSGELQEGVIFCPPEGDMGTGMVCANAVMPKTGQISSGTSANLTVVLEKPLKNYYSEIDIIASPAGDPSALIHTNNCTSEINQWINMFAEVAELCGAHVNMGELFEKLFKKSAQSDDNVGGLTGYNFLAGEPLAGTVNGAPLVARTPDGKLNLANFMQMQIYSAVSALSLGLDILAKEQVKVDRVTAHGGFYKTPVIGQVATSAVVKAPVTVLENAGEGGAWGIALLARYTTENILPLGQFLEGVFKDVKKTTLTADEKENKKYENFIKRYNKNLNAEKLISEN